ncbi:malate synthase [Psychrosphaera ytuae]|uniref:Malate synthase n=1 Tax=Psychrosphaera ytuae TaxID=2820710 RepID=A0A975DAG2_9GAMM|nr:malate synthase [Psychrosphaera ytuae]QTH63304.1 malate synthase [Psychrosphaera ytuae]
MSTPKLDTINRSTSTQASLLAQSAEQNAASAETMSEVVSMFAELDEQTHLHVINYSKQFLDSVFPLEHGSHKDVKSYVVYYRHLLAFLEDGTQAGLAHPEQFVALSGHKENPSSIVLKTNGYHVEILFNPCGEHGRRDKANIDDIQVETFEDKQKASEAQSLEHAMTNRRWFSLLKKERHFKLDANGQPKYACLNVAKEFTNKDGEDYQLN